MPSPTDRERWRRIEEICDEALKRAPRERDAYVASACGGDVELRRQVEALLAHEHTAERFLDASAGAVAASVMSRSDADLVGTRLGNYDITARLGEGGMGVVYRARDRRLDRDVALKLVAGDRHLSDGGRRLRHEARAAARLNHPNICTVYEVAVLDGVTCISMELVEGASVRTQLASGAFTPDLVCRIGHQIADALDHAHERGIIHRDLKTSNIMLRPDGRVKVIDFGIANREAQPADVTQTPGTGSNAGLKGTLAYVAPELLQGATPDARSDLWSLGIVLYEMVAGRLPFDGRTESDLAAAILRDPVPPLPAKLPAALAGIITRCLARTPHGRPAGAQEVAAGLSTAGEAARSPAGDSRAPVRTVAAAVAALLVIGVAAIYVPLTDRESSNDVVRFENPAQVTNMVGVEDSPAWSPDGRMLAYSASPTGGVRDDWSIWVVQPGAGEPINRTDGFAGRHLFPVWSPNGSQIAFWSSRDGGGCYVMPALAGAPRRVTATGPHHSGPPQWSADGGELSCVSGGEADAKAADRVTVSLATGLISNRVALPGEGRPRLFVTRSTASRLALVPTDGGLDADVSQLWVVDAAKPSSVLMQTDGKSKVWSPQWSPDGRTLYYLTPAGAAMSLWAQRFDTSGRPEGAPTSLTAGIDLRSFAWSADARRLSYSLGRRIANVYRVRFDTSRVSTWADVEQLTFDQAYAQCVAVDQVGQRLVISSDRNGSFDLWMLPASGGTLTPITTDPSAEWCGDWSPDGSTIAFFAFRSGNRDVWTIPADGGPWRQITDAPSGDVHPLWSFDGTELFYAASRNGLGAFRSPRSGGNGQLLRPGWAVTPSPIDRRFVAQATDGNLAVRDLDPAGAETPLPASSSGSPRWTPDGRFIVTRPAADRIHIVAADGRSPDRPLINLGGRRGSLGIYGTPTDGKYIYFIWTEDVGDIWVMDVAK